MSNEEGRIWSMMCMAVPIALSQNLSGIEDSANKVNPTSMR